MKQVVVLFAVLFLILSTGFSVNAQSASIPLLALVEQGNQTTGSVAELRLEIMQGKGRVFLETLPLTKVTTQISLRFAQQIACKELDVDCSDKDFFFTIKSSPGIVGGPSAGGAATVLTAAVLKNLSLRKDIAMTGTINSGGLIGPVGGIGQKIKAGAQAGLTTLIVPKGTEISAERSDNNTIEIEDFSAIEKKIGANITEVSTFSQALELFTGYSLPEPTTDFFIDPSYQFTMQSVAERLCNRTQSLFLQNQESETSNVALNLSRKAAQAFENKAFYSSASYCFRANTLLSQEMASNNSDVIEQNSLFTEKEVQEFSDKTDSRELQTISDLQTYMMVRERLQEVTELLKEVKNSSYTAGRKLAYAQERFESAKTWALFFNGKDKRFIVDDELIKHSCEQKIAEADERYNYVQNYFPNSVKETQREIIRAQNLLEQGQFAYCLFTSARIKADSDALISLLGVKQQDVNEIIQTKLNAVKRALIRSQEKGVFPLIGYSYYEYADSLRNSDKNTALLFAEYALELANLDIYFPEKQIILEKQQSVQQSRTSQNIIRGLLVFSGLIIGFLTGILVSWIKTRARARRPLRGKKR